VGNSGGGNLTAYIAALDPRVAVAAICCYITTLPLRMGNRIQDDPDADPEQDLFGFVSAGIDHAGLLALLAPRPTLLGTARDDFFPIAGARASFAEAQRLYEVAGAEGRIERVEAPGRHGLSVTLRQAVYAWFERWLLGREPADADAEIPVRPRTPAELLVCPEGQVNVSFRSRPLLPLALEEFHKQPPIPRRPLRQLLRLDLDQARPRLTETVAGRGAGALLIVGIDGNEAPRWNQERGWLDALSRAGHRVVIAEPRGVGASRPRFTVPGRAYADPLTGVEENLAYNAFLVGRSLLGMRVADVLTALARLRDRGPSQPTVLCGRRDAALVACFAAAVEPTVQAVALEEPRLSFRPLFRAEGSPINAASILPNLLRDFGDLPEVLARIAPRKVLVSAPIDEPVPLPASVLVTPQRFTQSPALLIDWLAS
jgi:hypothetical protein